MADGDGIEVVRFVRTAPQSPQQNIPILMLTGNTEAHYVLTARDTGANGYLIKPFSADQLVKRIRSIIELPRDFIISPTYCGPDRRHVNKPPPGGVERRKTPPPKQRY